MGKPVAWPGFGIVDATDIALTDAFQRNLVVTGSADRQEGGKWEDAVKRVDASPLFHRLGQTLSRYVKRDAYGAPIAPKYPVNARALKEAMRVSWLGGDLSHLVMRYESEWGGNMSRWEAITPLMRNARENWQCELQRIQKLQWWNEVKGKVAGFPASPVVYHIHPIALVANFSSGGCDCEARFKKISKIILSHEGGFSDRAGDKGGATNHGIAWAQWQAYAKEDLGLAPTIDNLKALSEEQAEVIYLKRYWEPKGFCKFKNERVALMIYDWTITSGGAVRQIQKMLNEKYGAGVSVDGIMGSQSVNTLVSISDQDKLLSEITALRKQYYNKLVENDASQIVNLRGWLNRVDDCLKVSI